MDKHHAPYAEEQKTIVAGTNTLLILIAKEKHQDTTDEKQLQNSSLERGEEEARTASQHKERTAYHTRVDAYQGIGVVQLYHEIGGQREAAELHPPLAVHQSAQQPHHEDKHRHPGQCQSAFSNLIL